MPGIYDRIGGDDNIAVNLIDALLTIYREGDIARATIRDVLNNNTEVPLDTKSQSDLIEFCDDIDASADKERTLRNIRAYMIPKEMNVPEMTEAIFRNRLNLSP